MPERPRGAAPARRRSRRRWLRRLGLFAAAVAVLVALAPYIVSTRPVTSLIVSLVNDRIRGRISVEDISIGWTGQSRIRGLSVTDHVGREVLSAESITLAGGLWAFITSPEKFRQIELACPRAEIRVLPEGGISLTEAISQRERPRKPKPPRERRGPPLEPAGRIVLRDGLIRFVPAPGRSYELSHVNGQVDIDTLNAVIGSLRVCLPEGGAIQADFDLHGPADEPEPRWDRLSGSLTVRTTEGIELGPLSRLAGLAEPLAGRLDWSGTAQTRQGIVEVTGQGRVDDFIIGPPGKNVREPQVRFDQAIDIDHRRQVITFRKLTANSELLTLSVDAGGTISRYETEKILNLSGRYAGPWERLTVLLHQFVPATAQYVDLSGPADGAFRLTGAAERPSLTPVYRDLDAAASVGWTSARVAGFALGVAKFLPELKGGQVVVPPAEVAASGGTIHLGGIVDMRPGEPVLSLPGRTVILRDLRINPEVGEKLLSRFNPIFGKLVSLEGRVSLATRDDIRVPLASESTLPARGSGTLDLSGIKVRPDGLLAQLLALGGLGADRSTPVEIGSVDFRIEQNRRISYDNFTVKFGDTFDLKFRGSVGLDGKLDLVVSVPVRAAILERFGVTGPLLDYARLLEGARIDIPIRGTRLDPEFSLQREAIQRLVSKAVQALLKEEAQKLLKDALERRTGKNDAGLPTPQAPQRKGPVTTAPARPEEMLLEDLFDVLDKVTRQKRKN
jgi:hypothetical protein